MRAFFHRSESPDRRSSENSSARWISHEIARLRFYSSYEHMDSRSFVPRVSIGSKIRKVKGGMFQRQFSFVLRRIVSHRTFRENVTNESWSRFLFRKSVQRLPDTAWTTCCVSIKRAHLDTSRFHEPRWPYANPRRWTLQSSEPARRFAIEKRNKRSIIFLLASRSVSELYFPQSNLTVRIPYFSRDGERGFSRRLKLLELRTLRNDSTEPSQASYRVVTVPRELLVSIDPETSSLFLHGLSDEGI